MHQGMAEDIARTYREDRAQEAEAYRRSALVPKGERYRLALWKSAVRVSKVVVAACRVSISPPATPREIPFGHGG